LAQAYECYGKLLKDGHVDALDGLLSDMDEKRLREFDETINEKLDFKRKEIELCMKTTT